MEVPPAGHPVWSDIVTGQAKYQLDFLAAKILLGWLMLKVKSDPSPGMVETCAQALHHLFAQNHDLPCVQHDLEQIFRGGVR